MPRRDASIEVDASPDTLWTFLRDFEALCACIPGVERVEVRDARHATLTVKEKVGVVPMVLALDASIESEDPPHGLRAVARCEHLAMAIDVALQRAGAKTLLLTTFDVTGSGPLKPIVDNLFERRATERTAEFSAALGKRFGARGVDDAGAPAATVPSPATLPAPAPAAGGWFDSIVRWLRSLLARRTP